MLHKKINWPVLIISIIAYIVAGTLSWYMWEKEGNTRLNAFLPGLIFTSGSILIFVLNRIECKPVTWLAFYLAMCITYMFVYYITFLTVWVGFLTGIFTGGLGALATFMLTDILIVKISFSKKHVFILGSLAFLIHDIFIIDPLKQWIEDLFARAGLSGDFYGNVIWLWQIIVGTKLVLTLQKAGPQKVISE